MYINTRKCILAASWLCNSQGKVSFESHRQVVSTQPLCIPFFHCFTFKGVCKKPRPLCHTYDLRTAQFSVPEALLAS